MDRRVPSDWEHSRTECPPLRQDPWKTTGTERTARGNERLLADPRSREHRKSPTRTEFLTACQNGGKNWFAAAIGFPSSTSTAGTGLPGPLSRKVRFSAPQTVNP